MWLRIEDHVPQVDQEVWYYFEVTGVSKGHFYFSEPEPGWKMKCFGSNDGWLCEDVTHWMPVEWSDDKPDPPKED